MTDPDTANNNVIENLQRFTEDSIKKYQIPALSVAVWKDGSLYQGAAGCLNLDTSVEATPDSIFQIGSITKVLTTCLVMKLVEQGRIDLDSPVKTYLRRFQIADAAATSTITVRQLLNHTNGIAGDYFPDDINEDGPHIARYVDRCAQLPLVHPVGEGFSYSNAAFAIVGHLVEVVAGISWYDAIEEWIYQPLGMTKAISRPQNMIRFRTALGHLTNPEKEGQWLPGSGKFLTLGQAPAGSTLTMTAADLVSFGRAHLDGGIGQGGQRWLSEALIQQMQTPTVDIPIKSSILQYALGLGWFCYETIQHRERFIGHAGATNNQLAALRVFPESNACFALLLNAESSSAFNQLVNQLTLGVSGIQCEEPTAVYRNMKEEQLQCIVGYYQAYAGNCDVRLQYGRLAVRFEDSIAEVDAEELSLRPLDAQNFELKSSDGISIGRMRFLSPDKQGKPKQLFFGARLYTRV